MFALEVTFTDGISKPELMFVRRPQALIGGSDYAHVVIEDMKSLGYQLRIFRGLNGSFDVSTVVEDEQKDLPPNIDGSYDRMATLDLGTLRLGILSLDTDLDVKEREPIDRAGMRIMRMACGHASPNYPAVMIPGSKNALVSFRPDQPVLVGRSSACAVRLDAADISSRHARIGYESGSFWVEDLGSTNGTFVGGQQVSGKCLIDPEQPIVLGRDVSIFVVSSEEQLTQIQDSIGSEKQPVLRQENSYPILLSVSEVARPARLVMRSGGELRIGRDPSSDLWLGAPHVSRHHCTVSLLEDGALLIQDYSRNGTAHNRGLIRKGESLCIENEPAVLNFGNEVTVAICHTEDQEKDFIASQGSPNTFSTPEEVEHLNSIVRQDSDGDLESSIHAGITGDRNMAGIINTRTLKGAYRRLSFRRKLLLVFSVFLLIMVIAILLKLLMPVIINV